MTEKGTLQQILFLLELSVFNILFFVIMDSQDQKGLAVVLQGMINILNREDLFQEKQNLQYFSFNQTYKIPDSLLNHPDREVSERARQLRDLFAKRFPNKNE